VDGQTSLAIEAARKVAAKIPDDVLSEMPMLAGFRIIPLFALSRFGRWDEVLREPAPPSGTPFYEGIWHYARGLAFLGKRQMLDAEGELVAVRKALQSPDLDAPLFSPNTMRSVLTIAPEVLAGEIAAARRDCATAVAHLERAIRLDDGLVYTEPAEWHYPPRHALGAVLLEAGRPAEAETVYWEDLRRNPENGWALTGLMQAVKAQGRTPDAGLIAARLDAAWRRADLRPTASRISETTLVVRSGAAADVESARPFEALARIQSPAGAGSMAPRLEASPDGRVFLSWLDGRITADGSKDASTSPPGHGHGGGTGAMTPRSTAVRRGTAVEEDVLVDARVCDCCPTAATRTSRGVVVAYRDRTDAEIRDISIARFVDGRWQAGGSVHSDGWEIEGCPVNGPALASMGENVALAWFTAARGEGRVQVAFSRDGGISFGEPVRVDGGSPLGRVDVELLPDGSAVVLWIESSPGKTDLRSRRVLTDGRRGPAAVVASVSADGSSGHPRVVRSGNELYFTWREPAPESRVVVAVAGVPRDESRWTGAHLSR
jgi:tetratricopeptide (TPR) repeat protein